ncbi:hypothetical protein [Sedimentibacter sp.]|uniref:hypothetical protein n=1 Tax=Sedimentibacter sp. TaxID=1960295 RepID=UPI0028A6A388|nr:hypothetical protein [Sedimentibacter sp.]
METIDFTQVIENQNQIITLLSDMNTYLYYIEGFFLFIIVVVLCVFAYRLFNIFFR